MSQSQEILAGARLQWQLALDSPLIKAMSDGTIDAATFARYRAREFQFVHAAVRMRAAAIVHAPSRRAIQGHYAALTSLLGEHAVRLEEDTSVLGLGVAARLDEGNGDAANQLVRRSVAIAVAGGYGDILCCLLASESLYEYWCGRAQPGPNALPELVRWITLHTSARFKEEVAFVRGEVDELRIDGDRRGHLIGVVAEILRLEREFHDAAYMSSGSAG